MEFRMLKRNKNIEKKIFISEIFAKDFIKKVHFKFGYIGKRLNSSENCVIISLPKI